MKKQQILNAATDLFMRLGFGAVTMDKVAQEAKVSKATVYAHFSSKEILFSAILENYFEQSAIAIPLLSSSNPLSEAEFLSELANFLGKVHNYYTNPAVIKLYRLLIGEVNKFPEIFDWVFGKQAIQTTSRLADFLLGSQLFNFESPQAAYLIACKIMDMLRGVTLWPQLVNNYHKYDLYPDADAVVADILDSTKVLLKMK